MSAVTEIQYALVNLNISGIADLTKAALEDGVPPIDILNRGLLPGMKTIGDQFREGRIFLPELILSGRTMKEAMALLKQAFKTNKITGRGKIAIGTVKDDIHDIVISGKIWC